MDGVMILEETMTRGLSLVALIILVISALVVSGFFSLYIIGICYNFIKLPRPITAIIVLVVIAFGVIGISENGFYEYKRVFPKYTVTVDDDVNFNEFMNKYEILGRNGNVYIVIDRM